MRVSVPLPEGGDVEVGGTQDTCFKDDGLSITYPFRLTFSPLTVMGLLDADFIVCSDSCLSFLFFFEDEAF